MDDRVLNNFDIKEVEVSMSIHLFCSNLFRTLNKKLKKIFIDARIEGPKFLGNLDDIAVEIGDYDGKELSIEEFHPIVFKIFDEAYKGKTTVKLSTVPEDSAYRLTVK